MKNTVALRMREKAGDKVPSNPFVAEGLSMNGSMHFSDQAPFIQWNNPRNVILSYLMDKAIKEARLALAEGGAGVVALLSSPDNVIAIGLYTIQVTGNMLDHVEMVLLRATGYQLRTTDHALRRSLRVYVTLEPCLICSAALSFVGIKRIVYASFAKDANAEEMIVRGLTLPKANDHLLRGPFILVPGVRRNGLISCKHHP